MSADDPYRPPDEGPEEQRGPSPPGGQPYLSQVPESEIVAPAGGGSRAWGVATGIVAPVLLVVVLPLGASLLSGAGASQAADTVFGSLLLLPVVLLVAAVVLAAVPRTRRFGVGMLLGLGILLLVGAGTCVALLAGLTAMNS